jgi:hypothetical protein
MQSHSTDHRATHRRERIARWVSCVSRTALALTVAGSLSVTGCRQLKSIAGKDNKQDLLEAELRTREREILELRSENQQLKQLTDIYVRQGSPEPVGMMPGGTLVVPNTANTASAAVFPVRSLTLGTGTGGRDDDGLPGDETLQVVIVPKDDEGTAVKVPGRVQVTAAEVTTEGLKVPIGKWEVSAEQLKKTWKGGLLSSGYFVPLQWDQAPTSERVRVTVRFVTADGRSYEADKDVVVKPLVGLNPRVVQPQQQQQPFVIGPQPDAVTMPAPSTTMISPPIPSGFGSAPMPASVLPPPAFPAESNTLPPPRVVDDKPAKAGSPPRSN